MNYFKPKEGIAVDGSAMPNPGAIQWQVTDIATSEVLYTSKSYLKASNNIAEFLAIVHGLALTRGLGSVIYSDSQTARAWVKIAMPKMDSIEGTELLVIVKRAILWLHNNPKEIRRVMKWDSKNWGENPADFGRK